MLYIKCIDCFYKFVCNIMLWDKVYKNKWKKV